MRYKEYPPPKELSPWIKCIWVFQNGPAEESADTIVPDGYPELLVHFGVPYSEADRTGNLSLQPTAVLSGQITGPLFLHTPGGAGLVSIRFRPAGLIPFTTTPARILTNVRVPANELFRNVDEYVNDVCSAANDIDRVSHAVRFLFRSFREVKPHFAIGHAVDVVLGTHGNVAVEKLATRLDMSRRNLELQFLHHVGVTPKQFCRIIRFRNAFDLLGNQDSQATSVALESGFFDQSHLIRDFRKFAGTTPAAFFEKGGALSHALSGK